MPSPQEAPFAVTSNTLARTQRGGVAPVGIINICLTRAIIRRATAYQTQIRLERVHGGASEPPNPFEVQSGLLGASPHPRRHRGFRRIREHSHLLVREICNPQGVSQRKAQIRGMIVLLVYSSRQNSAYRSICHTFLLERLSHSSPRIDDLRVGASDTAT